jgi:hypothetical protein
MVKLMLLLLHVISLTYLVLLSVKRYPVSLSMYWVVIFYAIYVLTPSIRMYSTTLSWVGSPLAEEIASYSLVGFVSFVIGNVLFLSRMEFLDGLPCGANIEIQHSTAKKVFVCIIIVTMILFLLKVGIWGLRSIFTFGSREYWLGKTSKSLVDTLSEWSWFYVGVTGSVLVLSADSKQNRRRAWITFLLVEIFASTVVFARRHVVYPVFAIVFQRLSTSRNKRRVVTVGLLAVPAFFIMMVLMGYLRTYGVYAVNLAMIIDGFRLNRFTDLFFSNTDFAASYYFLSRQVAFGGIRANPLGYLKLLFAPIPRAIWASKPNYTSMEILSVLEPVKVSQGFSAATGYIGEALATMGVGGIVLVSMIWGVFCGYLDKKYYYRLRAQCCSGEKDGHARSGFTVFDLAYIYAAILLITESHRGDFGASSIHYVLEIIFPAIVFSTISNRQRNNKPGHEKNLLG